MIVYCHLLNDYSGSPRVLYATSQALKDSRESLLFVGSQGSGILDRVGVPLRKYWYQRSRFRIVTLLTYLISQVALYRGLARADDIPRDAIVFVNTLLPFAAMVWGRLTGRAVVVHVHEVSISPAPLKFFLAICAARCADRLIYVSRDHLSRLPINDRAARIIFNPVDPEMQAKITAAPPYKPRRSGKFEVLMLASFKGYKGIEEFISLADDFCDNDDIKFKLVLNAEAGEVASFTSRHTKARNVSIYPRTNDPTAFYATADVLLNLSRVDEWIETFGLTILEAMAFGIPVIVPPIGGPAEIVSDGQEGFCIDSRDGVALREAVCALADAQDLAMEMSRAASARASGFTFEAYSQELREMIQELVARSSGDGNPIK